MKAHEQYRKDLVNLLGDVGRAEGQSQYEVFRDFLECAYRSIRGSLLIGDQWQENEDQYMRIASTRRCDKTMNRMSEMLGITTLALEVSCEDFLGPVFMDVAAGKELGQFFTPAELNRLIARFIYPMDQLLKDRRYFTAQEPAAGMGGMVLAVAEIMREHDYCPAWHCHWQMVEIEFKAMCGCYIQTSLAGVSGIVIHGDTLRLTQNSATPTPMARLFPKSFEPKQKGEAQSPCSGSTSTTVAREDDAQLQLNFDLK